MDEKLNSEGLVELTPEIRYLSILLSVNADDIHAEMSRKAGLELHLNQVQKFPEDYPDLLAEGLQSRLEDIREHLRHLRDERKSLFLRMDAAREKAGLPKSNSSRDDILT